MQARIQRAASTDHDPSSHYFQLSMHHNGHPEWEWTILPITPNVDPRERILIGLYPPIASMRTAPETLLALTDTWITLDEINTQWIHRSLLEPIIQHIHFHLQQIRNINKLPESTFALYQALTTVQQQAHRHILYTQPTIPNVTGRWMRSSDAIPTPASSSTNIVDEFLNYGLLEIYGPSKHDLLMTLEIQRWADGIYWINTDRTPQVGAIIPGSLLMYLDSLSSGTFHTSDTSLPTSQPDPVTLHPELQHWLTETFLWFHHPQLQTEQKEEALLQQAHELSPEQPGIPGRQYDRRIAYARVIQGLPIDDIDH